MNDANPVLPGNYFTLETYLAAIFPESQIRPSGRSSIFSNDLDNLEEYVEEIKLENLESDLKRTLPVYISDFYESKGFTQSPLAGKGYDLKFTKSNSALKSRFKQVGIPKNGKIKVVIQSGYSDVLSKINKYSSGF